MSTLPLRLPVRLLALIAACFTCAKGADEPAAKPIFDGKSLTGWKITDFAGRGEVTVKDEQLILAAGDPLTGVNCTQEAPKTNYELSLEAMRIEGSDFFCGLTFPVGATSVTFVVGGWGGTLVGISSIDGEDASENSTTQFVKFDSKKWYKIRVRVTPAKIQAWINDEQQVDVSAEGKKLGMRAGEIELSAPFGIATFRTEAALKNIQIKPIAAEPPAAK